MIEYLRIKNLVLMDLCEVHFNKGLTIITGETGAGKTALIQGLHLILGERADSSLIRKGEEKSHIEASFDISNHPKIKELLSSYGIDYNEDEPLIITRELFKEGKSRAFINHQAATLSLLQSIGQHLIHIIGQHSYHELKSHETLREIIDLFGSLEPDLEQYKKSFEALKEAQKKLEDLEQQLLEKERNFEKYKDELAELTSAQLKESEEDELFEVYSFNSKAQEIGEKSKEICRALSEGPRPILRELSHFKYACEQLISAHSTFLEQTTLLQEAIVALQEVDHGLQKILSSLDHNPRTLEQIEERLSLYNRIKKKYGPTFQDWKKYQCALEEKMHQWELLDEAIETAKEEEALALKELQRQADLLTKKRNLYAKALEEKLSSAICELNMPGASVTIEIKPQVRNSTGQDHITFWLQANKGEKPASLRDSTSGGELSRLLLAIKTTLAEKNNTPTIIFDEIDANVGGTTATLIGDKLIELSRHRQVFCITHFPQVAKKADLHLRVFKQDKDERTIARLEKLGSKEREKELLRMLGGEKVS